MAPYILTVGLNPVWQTTLAFPALRLGEVNRSREYTSSCAGKGFNVTRVLHQAGLPVKHLTFADAPNGFFYKSAVEQKLPMEFLSSATPVRGCYTLLDRAGGTTTEIVENGNPVPEGAEKDLMERFDRLLGEAALVVLSGSHAEGFSDAVYPALSRRAKEAGKYLILDIRGNELEACLPFRPDLIKPNREEFCHTFLPGEDYHQVPEPRLSDVMNSLYDRWGTSSILTNGTGSTLICDRGKIGTSRPRPLENWINPIGCGDAYTAGLAAEIFQGRDIPQGVKTAQEFARRNAMSFIPGDILSGGDEA